MADIRAVWDIQKLIGTLHLYVMGVNSLVILIVLILYRKSFFNIFNISTPPGYILTFGYLTMPLYYLLESYTTVTLCHAYLHYTCRYAIHHMLTISLTFSIFQYSFFNFFTLITPVVHGLMNIGYYYSPNLQYILCRWYAIYTVLSLLYFIILMAISKKFRIPSGQVVIIGLALAYNNLYTPELVEMCESNENVQLFIGEIYIHALGGLFTILAIFFYSKPQKNYQKLTV